MLSVSKRAESIPGECLLKKELSSSPISQVFSCTFNDKNAIIRLDLPAASYLAIDRKTEFLLLNNIQHLAITPKILYQNILEGILITEFIDGKELSTSNNYKDNIFKLLGRNISLIHETPIPKNCKDIFYNSMQLYQSLLEHSPHKTLLKQTLTLHEELSNNRLTKVLSHNDLHPRNLLWANKYYFLDWEYAGPNDRYFDIASVIKTFQLNKSQILELLSGYSSNAKIFDIDKINKWIVFIYNLDKLWKISVERVNQT